MNSCFRAAMLLIAAFLTLSAGLPDPKTDLEPGTVSGTVIDQLGNQPIAYASVVVKRVSDSTVVTGGITTEDGQFNIEKLPDGEFVLEVQYLGYEVHSEAFTIDGSKRTAEVGTIMLKEHATALTEVELVAERAK